MTDNFYQKIAKIHNSGQSRSIVVCGNIYDIFWNGADFVPLIPFLCEKSKTQNLIQIVYELNGPVRINEEDKTILRNAWIKWKTGEDPAILALKEIKNNGNLTEKYTKEFDSNALDSIGNPQLALEFLRQLTVCSRKVLKQNLFIIVEAADLLIPAGNNDISSLNDRVFSRLCIVQDWINDPAFINGHDTVLLIAESRGLIHSRISKLPQVISVDVPSPDLDLRKLYLEKLNVVSDFPVAELTAGLSLHAMRQLIKAGTLDRTSIINKVEEFIQNQLGEDVVEFKKPTHTLDDCVGFSKLKKFLREVFIPRIKNGSLSGAGVSGPIGGGKSYIFEATASEMGMPVLVLKNIRSQWFGQTDVVVEKLKRVLNSLEKVLILIDEADTVFGGLGEGIHESERRLTGKFQGMISDPAWKGKIYWLLVTARIHLLSPDLRRPGRIGDTIIPVLDPIGEDRLEFLKWTLQGVGTVYQSELEDLLKLFPEDYSAASFTSLKNNFKGRTCSIEEIKTEIRDFIQPAIYQTRRYQVLQSLVNCTRRSLLPNPDVTEEERQKWELEIKELESIGIK